MIDKLHRARFWVAISALAFVSAALVVTFYRGEQTRDTLDTQTARLYKLEHRLNKEIHKTRTQRKADHRQFLNERKALRDLIKALRKAGVPVPPSLSKAAGVPVSGKWNTGSVVPPARAPTTPQRGPTGQRGPSGVQGPSGPSTPPSAPVAPPPITQPPTPPKLLPDLPNRPTLPPGIDKPVKDLTDKLGVAH